MAFKPLWHHFWSFLFFNIMGLVSRFLTNFFWFLCTQKYHSKSNFCTHFLTSKKNSRNFLKKGHFWAFSGSHRIFWSTFFDFFGVKYNNKTDFSIIAHNSLIKGRWAYLTLFLEFHFFWTFFEYYPISWSTFFHFCVLKNTLVNQIYGLRFSLKIAIKIRLCR